MEVQIKINCSSEDELARLAAALATLQTSPKRQWTQFDKDGNAVAVGWQGSPENPPAPHRWEVASGEAGEIVATPTGDAAPVSEVVLAADPAPEPEKRGRGRPKKKPTPETEAALRELEAGGGERFETVADLMADLNDAEPAPEPVYADQPTASDPQSVIQVAPADLVVDPPVQQEAEQPGDDVPSDEEIAAYIAKCRELNGKFMSTGRPAEELLAVYNRFPHKDNPALQPSTAGTVHPSCLAKLVAAVDACVNG